MNLKVTYYTGSPVSKQAATAPKVIYQKFQPIGKHPRGPKGPELPWIYAPEHGAVFLGPANSYHSELVQHVPQIKDMYEGNGVPPYVQRPDHVHGRMSWPDKDVYVYNEWPDDTKQAITSALGGTLAQRDYDDPVSWQGFKASLTD